MQDKETVKIGTRTYTVKYQGRVADDCHGICFFPKGKRGKGLIIIKTGQPPTMEFDTILHEVMHGICHSTKLGYDYEEEEKIVAKLSAGLTRFFKDNPEFTTRLMSLL